jgi:hypothetical protein
LVSSTYQLDGRSDDRSEGQFDRQIDQASGSRPKEAEMLGPNRWVVNPVIDVLFVSGGLLWALFAIQIFFFHYISPDVKAPGMAGHVAFFLLVASTLGAYLFSDAHTIATYMRIYATAENRKRFALYAYVLPWGSLLLFSLCLMYPEAAGFCVYLHLMWVYQHYVGQSFGISLIYCYKRKYFFKPWERETYRWFMHSMSAAVITRILCDPDFSPHDYFGVKLPFYHVPFIFHSLAKSWFLFMAAAFIAIVIFKYIKERQLIPVPTLSIILTVLGIGVAGGFANSIVWVFGPAFFHGSQYLAVSLGFYLKEKGLEEGKMAEVGHHLLRAFFSKPALRYWGIVVSAGLVIYVAIPHFLQAYGYSFVVVATVIQACVNFHHFVTDGAVWRLRDKKCRDILLA